MWSKVLKEKMAKVHLKSNKKVISVGAAYYIPLKEDLRWYRPDLSYLNLNKRHGIR